MSVSRLVGLAGLLFLTGCSLNRGAPPEQHYVLGGGRFQQASVPAPELGDIAVGIRRLQLAPYLQSNSVVVRGGDHAQELSLSEFHRWSEPLGEGINRALAGYLTAAGSFRVVDVAPWSAGAEHDYLIELSVLRFEGVGASGGAAPEGEAHVVATWAIIRKDDGEILMRGTTDHRRPGWRVGDYAGLVALLDGGVEAIATDLMNSLDTLPAR